MIVKRDIKIVPSTTNESSFGLYEKKYITAVGSKTAVQRNVYDI